MKVWLDDIVPSPGGLIWIKSAEELIELIKTGQVTSIDFDHDLGKGKKTGYDVACFIEESVIADRLKPPYWSIHSGNPVGANRIQAAMKKAHAIFNRRSFTL